MGQSGYSKYNVEQAERARVNESGLPYPPFPVDPTTGKSKKYSVIYADPPWDYGGKMQFDRSASSKHNEDWNDDIFISSAQFKYPTMKLADLKEIPVSGICEDDCLLFMWVTSPHLKQGIELGEAWGFDYRTVAFVWDKQVHNPGQYTLSYCEMCLVFKKGRIPTPRGTRNEKQLVSCPRGEHSAKPDEVREAIVRMFPSHDRIELFARFQQDQCPADWDVWGLEA